MLIGLFPVSPNIEIAIDPIDTVIFDHFADDGSAVCLGSWVYNSNSGKLVSFDPRTWAYYKKLIPRP